MNRVDTGLIGVSAVIAAVLVVLSSLPVFA